jgi:GR25 family glycosyltransferase involved in LPS biosynthesis
MKWIHQILSKKPLANFSIKPNDNKLLFWMKFKWNFYKQPFRKMFEKQTVIDLDTYVQDVVVIHMIKRKDRYKKLKKESKRIKLIDGTLFDKIRIHEAVDGKKIKKKRRKDFEPEYTFQFWYDINPEPRWKDIKDKDKIMVMSSDPEIGISLSHMGVWKDIVKKKTPYTLILEDDFTINIGFQNKLKQALNKLPSDFDLLYLSYLPCSHGFKFDFYKNNLLKIHKGIWWLSGYILSYEGAKKLVDNFPVVGVVDLWVNHIIPSMNVYATKTLLIDQRINMKSDNVYSFISGYGNQEIGNHY